MLTLSFVSGNKFEIAKYFKAGAVLVWLKLDKRGYFGNPDANFLFKQAYNPLHWTILYCWSLLKIAIHVDWLGSEFTFGLFTLDDS